MLEFDPIEEAARQWRKRWGATPVPAMSAVTSIMRTHQILIARLNDALAPFEISFARYEALMLLLFSRAGSLPLGKMGARLQVHPASVTNLIDGLEKLGHVTREGHPKDRRTTLASITPRGREVAEAATQTMHEISFGTVPLRRGDLEQITATLRRLREGSGDFSSSEERPEK